MNKEALIPSEWRYIAEGMANVVLEYIGNNEIFVGKVMRVRKVKKNVTALEDEHAFSKNIISKLFDGMFVDSGVLVEVSQDFLSTISADIKKYQPSYRRHCPVDLNNKHVLILPNLTILSTASGEHTLAVELKPKSPIMCTHSLDPNSKFCRFCLMQYWKLKQKRIAIRSQYCPTALFSNDEIQINDSLQGLIQTPQNNFIVSIDGKSVFKGARMDGAEEEIKYTLEDLNTAIQGIWNSDSEIMSRIVTQILLREPILDKIAEFQMACPIDVSGLKLIYERYIKTGHVPGEGDKYGLDDMNLPVLTDLPAQFTVSLGTHSQCMGRKYQNMIPLTFDTNDTTKMLEFTESLSHDDCFALLNRFLLARTLMDISVIIAMRKVGGDTDIPCSSLIRDPVTNQGFEYKVSLIDCDERPFEMLPGYFEQDRMILESFHTSFLQ